MTPKTPFTDILRVSSSLQVWAQKSRRFVGNPHVDGDTVAEHVDRMTRIAVMTLPALWKEFPDKKDELCPLVPMIVVHEMGEMSVHGDVAAFIKDYGAIESRELQTVKSYTERLPKDSGEFILQLYNEHEDQHSLVAKLTKAFDRLATTAPVIEQKIGVIQPDYAKLSVEYVQKQLGVSNTTDKLIKAQINRILRLRKKWRTREELIRLAETFADTWGTPEELFNIFKLMLSIDLKNYTANRERAYIPITDSEYIVYLGHLKDQQQLF